MSTFNKVKEVIIDKLGIEEDAIKRQGDSEAKQKDRKTTRKIILPN